MRVVCNASPLVLLAKIHHLELLVQLYDEVIIPSSVWEEITAKPSQEVERIRARLQSRTLRIRKATKRALKGVSADLGLGEQETIALALQMKADLVVLDDQQGRRVAREKGLIVTGRLGSSSKLEIGA